MFVHFYARDESREASLMATSTVSTGVETRTLSPGRTRRVRRAGQSLTTAFLLVFLVYFLLPFFWLFVSATKTNPELFSSFVLWFASDFHFLSNLVQLFTFN